MKENQQLTLRLLVNNAFSVTDPELTVLIQSLFNDCPLLFQSLLSRSEINSLNEQIDEDEDEIDLTADPLHSRPRAIGCIRPKHVRLQLGFPVSPKEMDAAFSMDFTEAYRRDYGSPNVLHFGKTPLQWCKKLVFTDTYVCSLSLKFVALGRVKLMQPVIFHAVPSSVLAISSSTRISLLELIA
jgi:hypothetical protein